MKNRKPYQRRLRRTSGTIRSRDPLVDVLYTLMRDHVPTSVLATVVDNASSGAGEVVFTNGWLASYSKHLARRLRRRRR